MANSHRFDDVALIGIGVGSLYRLHYLAIIMHSQTVCFIEYIFLGYLNASTHLECNIFLCTQGNTSCQNMYVHSCQTHKSQHYTMLCNVQTTSFPYIYYVFFFQLTVDARVISPHAHTFSTKFGHVSIIFILKGHFIHNYVQIKTILTTCPSYWICGNWAQKWSKVCEFTLPSFYMQLINLCSSCIIIKFKTTINHNTYHTVLSE